jgi:hypothetical protein
LGWEEEVEAAGLEEDLDTAGLEDTSDGRGQKDENEEEEGHEEGHEEGAGLYHEGVGVTGLLQDRHSHTDLVVAT